MTTHSGGFVLRSLLAGCIVCVSASGARGPKHPEAPFQRPASRVALQTCKDFILQEEVRCGTYEVYEDRSAKSGRKISLNIEVVPSLSPNPAPDPVFWLEGGPGIDATGSANLAKTSLSEVRKSRDLVFVDQRGTGKSNPLNCDIGDSYADLQNFFGGTPLRENLLKCREALEKIANLAMYTTPIAMDDLDEIRDAMGYDKINVAGVSYGSVAAQVYLRQHGDHVRTAFLGDFATPTMKQPLQFPRAAQHALDLLLEDCAAEQNCNKSFPRLREELDAILLRFKDGPLRVDLIRPSDRQKQSVLLSGDRFAERLMVLMSTTGTAQFFPLIIHKAFENDYIPFESAAIRTNPTTRVARGTYFTITCSEGDRFITEEDLARETRGTFMGDTRIRTHMNACKEWPNGDVPASFLDPVKSAVPILMIAGEADPTVGPWYAETAIKYVPNGRLVKVRYYGHQFGDRCTKSIMAAFVERGSAAGLDASCANSIRRPPFATEFPERFLVQ